MRANQRPRVMTLPEVIGEVTLGIEQYRPYNGRMGVRRFAPTDRRRFGSCCYVCGERAAWWVGRPAVAGAGLIALLCDECREPVDVVLAVVEG